eukprot:15448129-Alexandrium_andersonii.AAC.1
MKEPKGLLRPSRRGQLDEEVPELAGTETAPGLLREEIPERADAEFAAGRSPRLGSWLACCMNTFRKCRNRSNILEFAQKSDAEFAAGLLRDNAGLVREGALGLSEAGRGRPAARVLAEAELVAGELHREIRKRGEAGLEPAAAKAALSLPKLDSRPANNIKKS